MLSPGNDRRGTAGTSTLTARLDRPSSADTTVDGIGGFNIDAFYTVGPGPNPVLTIPAGETASTGTVTITARGQQCGRARQGGDGIRHGVEQRGCHFPG